MCYLVQSLPRDRNRIRRGVCQKWFVSGIRPSGIRQLLRTPTRADGRRRDGAARTDGLVIRILSMSSPPHPSTARPASGGRRSLLPTTRTSPRWGNTSPPCRRVCRSVNDHKARSQGLRCNCDQGEIIAPRPATPAGPAAYLLDHVFPAQNPCFRSGKPDLTFRYGRRRTRFIDIKRRPVPAATAQRDAGGGPYHRVGPGAATRRRTPGEPPDANPRTARHRSATPPNRPGNRGELAFQR